MKIFTAGGATLYSGTRTMLQIRGVSPLPTVVGSVQPQTRATAESWCPKCLRKKNRCLGESITAQLPRGTRVEFEIWESQRVR